MKSTRNSKCSRIYKVLKEEILSGKYKPDDLFYSETELIKRFDVSRPTTIRVLRDLQIENLLIRRAGSGTYVSAPPQNQSGTWGTMMDIGESSQTLHPMISQLLNATRKINKTLIIGNHQWSELSNLSDEERLSILCKPFFQSKIEGLFFVPFYDFHKASTLDPFNQVFLDHIRNANIPVVFLDFGMEPFPQQSDYDLVSSDHFQGGYLLGKHLLQKSPKKICFLCTYHNEFIPSIQSRREGMMCALREKGLSLSTTKIDPLDIDQVKTFIDKEKPDLLACCTDGFAVKIMTTLHQLKIQIPQKIRILGFDNSPIAQYSITPITTIQQPYDEIAEVAIKRLTDRITKLNIPTCVTLLKPKLIIRNSCP
ncbi:MAG: substrate-binding domain-containing protein [Verrucomicrobiota bacterium]